MVTLTNTTEHRFEFVKHERETSKDNTIGKVVKQVEFTVHRSRMATDKANGESAPKPGVTVIPDEDWAVAATDPVVQGWLKSGLTATVTPGKAPESKKAA